MKGWNLVELGLKLPHLQTEGRELLPWVTKIDPIAHEDSHGEISPELPPKYSITKLLIGNMREKSLPL